MAITFRPAVRDRVSLLIGLAGASGSGKTYSALRMARGLAANGRIAVIDTEAGRAKHYSDQFSFLHGDLTPPFTPEAYIDAIEGATQAGADVVVIDSMSHEWAGDGGCQDIHAEIARAMATDRETGEVNPWKLEAMSAPAWREPKQRHKRMVSRFLQCRAHLIFCLRAEDKVKFVTTTDSRGKKKTAIEPAGWMPICEKGFMFEMTLSWTLAPDTPGCPRPDLPNKCQEQHRPFFPTDVPIGEEAGAALHAWATGGAAKAPTQDAARPARANTIAALVASIEAAESHAELTAPDIQKRIDWLRANKPEQALQVERARAAAYQRLGPPPDDESDDFPGDMPNQGEAA